MPRPTSASEKDDFLAYLKEKNLDPKLFEHRTKLDFRKTADKEEALKRIMAAEKKSTVDPATPDAKPPPRAPPKVSPQPIIDLSDPSPAPQKPVTAKASDRVLRSIKPEKMPNPRGLGTIESGRLLKTADFKYDMTQELLLNGAKMPEHVPLVSISFRSSDLGGDESVTGTDERAGHDPWAVADYIRDMMRWPKDSIFIDKEQFGAYNGKAGKERTYKNTPEIRPWCPSGDFKVDFPVTEAFVQNNWRGVFKWAQRVSPAILIFYSMDYYNSDQCFKELSGVLQECHEDCQLKEKRLVIFVQMDEEGGPKMRSQMKEMKNVSASQHIIKSVDISSYLLYLNGEAGKMSLKDAAFGLVDLVDELQKFFGPGGIGDIELVALERAKMVARKQDPSVQLLDIKDKPLRNRYLPECERRIKLVKRVNKASKDGVASAEDLQERLPGVGELKSELIWEVIRKNGKIDSLDQLARILSKTNPWQGKVFQQILPFITI
jgi:hypothetical protein